MSQISEVSIIKLGNKIIVPIQNELNDATVKRLQESILNSIENTEAKGLIIDVSTLSLIDSFLGRVLVDTAKMANIMGADTVLVGMRKEVVLTLIQLGLIITDICTALNIEDGIGLLDKIIGGDNGRHPGP